MAETWMTYGDLATALGISPEAARQKAIRGRWRRQRGNDGKALVLVDVEAEKTAHTLRRRPAERPDAPRTIAALESHIATLKDNVAKAEALNEQKDDEVTKVRNRLDEVVSELMAMSKMMAQSAAAESARSEPAAHRSRSWWKSIASWLESPLFPVRRPEEPDRSTASNVHVLSEIRPQPRGPQSHMVAPATASRIALCSVRDSATAQGQAAG